MGLISEDFVRCEICDGADFEQKRIVTIANNGRRQDVSKEYPTTQVEHRYFCLRCNHEKK